MTSTWRDLITTTATWCLLPRSTWSRSTTPDMHTSSSQSELSAGAQLPWRIFLDTGSFCTSACLDAPALTKMDGGNWSRSQLAFSPARLRCRPHWPNYVMDNMFTVPLRARHLDLADAPLSWRTINLALQRRLQLLSVLLTLPSFGTMALLSLSRRRSPDAWSSSRQRWRPRPSEQSSGCTATWATQNLRHLLSSFRAEGLAIRSLRLHDTFSAPLACATSAQIRLHHQPCDIKFEKLVNACRLTCCGSSATPARRSSQCSVSLTKPPSTLLPRYFMVNVEIISYIGLSVPGSDTLVFPNAFVLTKDAAGLARRWTLGQLSMPSSTLWLQLSPIDLPWSSADTPPCGAPLRSTWMTWRWPAPRASDRPWPMWSLSSTTLWAWPDLAQLNGSLAKFLDFLVDSCRKSWLQPIWEAMTNLNNFFNDELRRKEPWSLQILMPSWDVPFYDSTKAQISLCRLGRSASFGGINDKTAWSRSDGMDLPGSSWLSTPRTRSPSSTGWLTRRSWSGAHRTMCELISLQPTPNWPMLRKHDVKSPPCGPEVSQGFWTSTRSTSDSASKTSTRTTWFLVQKLATMMLMTCSHQQRASAQPMTPRPRGLNFLLMRPSKNWDLEMMMSSAWHRPHQLTHLLSTLSFLDKPNLLFFQHQLSQLYHLQIKFHKAIMWCPSTLMNLSQAKNLLLFRQFLQHLMMRLHLHLTLLDWHLHPLRSTSLPQKISEQDDWGWINMRRCSSLHLVPCDAVQDAMNLIHIKHLLQTHTMDVLSLPQNSLVKLLQSMTLVVVIYPRDGASMSMASSSSMHTTSMTTGRSKLVAWFDITCNPDIAVTTSPKRRTAPLTWSSWTQFVSRWCVHPMAPSRSPLTALTLWLRPTRPLGLDSLCTNWQGLRERSLQCMSTLLQRKLHDRRNMRPSRRKPPLSSMSVDSPCTSASSSCRPRSRSFAVSSRMESGSFPAFGMLTRNAPWPRACCSSGARTRTEVREPRLDWWSAATMIRTRLKERWRLQHPLQATWAAPCSSPCLQFCSGVDGQPTLQQHSYKDFLKNDNCGSSYPERFWTSWVLMRRPECCCANLAMGRSMHRDDGFSKLPGDWHQLGCALTCSIPAASSSARLTSLTSKPQTLASVWDPNGSLAWFASTWMICLEVDLKNLWYTNTLSSSFDRSSTSANGRTRTNWSTVAQAFKRPQLVDGKWITQSICGRWSPSHFNVIEVLRTTWHHPRSRRCEACLGPYNGPLCNHSPTCSALHLFWLDKSLQDLSNQSMMRTACLSLPSSTLT